MGDDETGQSEAGNRHDIFLAERSVKETSSDVHFLMPRCGCFDIFSESNGLNDSSSMQLIKYKGFLVAGNVNLSGEKVVASGFQPAVELWLLAQRISLTYFECLKTSCCYLELVGG